MTGFGVGGPFKAGPLETNPLKAGADFTKSLTGALTGGPKAPGGLPTPALPDPTGLLGGLLGGGKGHGGNGVPGAGLGLAKGDAGATAIPWTSLPSRQDDASAPRPTPETRGAAPSTSAEPAPAGGQDAGAGSVLPDASNALPGTAALTGAVNDTTALLSKSINDALGFLTGGERSARDGSGMASNGPAAAAAGLASPGNTSEPPPAPGTPPFAGVTTAQVGGAFAALDTAFRPGAVPPTADAPTVTTMASGATAAEAATLPRSAEAAKPTAAEVAQLDALGSPAADILRAGARADIASAADAAFRDLQLSVAPAAAPVVAGPSGPADRTTAEAARIEAQAILGPPAELPAATVAALLVAAGYPAPLEPGAPLPPGATAALALARADAGEGAPVLAALPGGARLPPDATVTPFGAGIEALSLPAAPAVGLRQEPGLAPEVAAFWSQAAPHAVEATHVQLVQFAFPAPPDPATLAMTVALGPGPNGAVATGVTILMGERTPAGAATPSGPPLTSGAAPDAPGPGATLHLGAGEDARREAIGAAYVTVTDPVPVPVDLGLGPDAAPLAEEPPRLWRLDDTAALVAVGPEGPAAAVAEGLALLARLRDGRLTRPADLARGQGIATYAGSPAHLRLSGIARPGLNGTDLTESDPPRIEVIRGAGEGEGWSVLRGGTVTRLPDADEALRLAFAYGVGAPAGPHGADPGTARARDALSHTLLAMEAARHGAEPDRARSALSAVASDWAEETRRRERLGPPPGAGGAAPALAMIAGLHGPLAAWEALNAAGASPGEVLRAASPNLRPVLALAFASGAALALAALGLPRDAGRDTSDGPFGLDAAREGFAGAASALLRGDGSWRDAAAALGAWGEAAIRAAPYATLTRGDGLAIASRLGRLRDVARAGR